jgi:hypothetical protein
VELSALFRLVNDELQRRIETADAAVQLLRAAVGGGRGAMKALKGNSS